MNYDIAFAIIGVVLIVFSVLIVTESWVTLTIKNKVLLTVMALIGLIHLLVGLVNLYIK